MNIDTILYGEVESKTALYDTLGCAPESTPEQIRAEYLKRVKGVHPDGQGTAAAAHDDGFTALQTAYGVLGDPRRRAHYDQWRLSGLSIPFKQFCNVSEDVVQSLHWQSRRTPQASIAASETNATPATRECATQTPPLLIPAHASCPPSPSSPSPSTPSASSPASSPTKKILSPARFSPAVSISSPLGRFRSYAP